MINEFLVATDSAILDTLIAETNIIANIGKPGDTTTRLADYQKNLTEDLWIMNYQSIINRCNGNKQEIIDCIDDLVQSSPDLTCVESEDSFTEYLINEGYEEVEEIEE